MGGSGSGRRYRWSEKKVTAEECHSLGIDDFRGRLYRHSTGTFTWRMGETVTGTINYFVTGDTGALTVELLYRWRDQEDIRVPVRLQATYSHFGGCRWWFTCPLISRGVPCNRRVRKLYLPPGGRYFGCRECWDLSYKSAQESHSWERVLAFVGRYTGMSVDGEVGKLLASRWGVGGG